MKAVLSTFVCFLCFSLAHAESLDDLFGQLKSSESEIEASVIEDKIWVLWHQGTSDEERTGMIAVTTAMQQGEYSLALKFATDLIDFAPEFAEAWNKRATLYYMMGNFEASITDVEKTLKLEPRHFGAWSGLGLILEQLGRIDAAIMAHETVLELHPTSTFTQLKLESLLALKRENSI